MKRYEETVSELTKGKKLEFWVKINRKKAQKVEIEPLDFDKTFDKIDGYEFLRWQDLLPVDLESKIFKFFYEKAVNRALGKVLGYPIFARQNARTVFILEPGVNCNVYSDYIPLISFDCAAFFDAKKEAAA